MSRGIKYRVNTASTSRQSGSIPSRIAICTLGVLGIACTLMAGGCYERVVRATGPGVDRVRVEEPYQQNYEVDEWLFGTKIKEVERRP